MGSSWFLVFLFGGWSGKFMVSCVFIWRLEWDVHGFLCFYLRIVAGSSWVIGLSHGLQRVRAFSFGGRGGLCIQYSSFM